MNFLGLPYRLSSSVGCEWILPEDLTKFDSSLTNSTLRQQFLDLIASSDFILPKYTYSTHDAKYKVYNWYVKRNLKFRIFEFMAPDNNYKLSETGLTPGKLNFSQVVELFIYCDESNLSEFFPLCPKLKKITLNAGFCLDYNNRKTWVLDINPDILQQLTHLIVTGVDFFRGLAVNENDWNHIAQNCKSLVEFSFTTFNIESNNHTPRDSEIIFDTLFSNNPTLQKLTLSKSRHSHNAAVPLTETFFISLDKFCPLLTDIQITECEPGFIFQYLGFVMKHAPHVTQFHIVSPCENWEMKSVYHMIVKYRMICGTREVHINHVIFNFVNLLVHFMSTQPSIVKLTLEINGQNISNDQYLAMFATPKTPTILRFVNIKYESVLNASTVKKMLKNNTILKFCLSDGLKLNKEQLKKLQIEFPERFYVEG
jgi:hypothetical protein